MFKVTFLAGLILASTLVSAFAQAPDPRDSVLIESKSTSPGFGGSGDTSAYLYLRVFITNKDSLGAILLSLEEKSVVGGGYGTLGRPRIFDGVVSRLTPTLGAVNRFSGGRYNSISPDTFVLLGCASSDLATVEPPNAIRKSLWEIKFDTVFSSCCGNQFVLDSANISPDTSIRFVDIRGFNNSVNFIKSIISSGGDSFPDFVDEKDLPGIPKTWVLSQNYPNPFNANTQIAFALPKSGRTKLEIFNVLGQKVNTLMDGYLSAGTKIVNWDGRDDRREPVPSGVYFYQLRSGEFQETKKMLVLK